MNKDKIILIVLGSLVVLAVLGAAIFNYVRGNKFGMNSTEFTYYASDLVGTHSGTSTVGVYFGDNRASTSTYVKRISTTKDNATLLFNVTSASSTAVAYFEIFGSNDDYCETTTTTATNYPNMTDINWYSAGDTIINRTHLSYLSTDSATSLLKWTNPTSTHPGPQVSMWNLNYECLRLDVAASSTILYVGIVTK